MYSYKLCNKNITNTVIFNLRNFSGICNNKTDLRSYEIVPTQRSLLRNNGLYLKPGLKYQHKNFSIDRIVQWQQETYASISNSQIVNFMQDGLLTYHEITGLSWWATIVTSTILIRALTTLPLTVYQNYILAKVENISLEFKDVVNELKKETAIAKKAYKLTDKQTMVLYKRSLKKQWSKLVVRDNCHPLKATIVIWVQIPVWVCMSFALRNLVYMQSNDAAALVTLMEMSAGGIGWIPNLTEPDHSWILPVAFGLTNLSIIELQRMSKLRQPSKMYNIFTNVFRVFSIAMIPVAASVPSCMCLYWLTSSSIGLVQNLVLISPAVRRKLGIPEAPSELDDPYNHIKNEIRLKIDSITTPIIASIYTSGRDENNFSRANEFLPHRWDRNDPRRKELTNHVQSASLPFALGARSCIGKKIAMIQLSEVINNIVSNFNISCENSSEVKAITSQILVPNQDVRLKLSLRGNNNN